MRLSAAFSLIRPTVETLPSIRGALNILESVSGAVSARSPVPLACLGIVLLFDRTVFAEPAPRAAILSPTVSTGAPPGLGGEVERALRADLDALEIVDTIGTPRLSAAELQIAVGCVGETAACLRAVAQELEVEVLVSSRIDRAGDELVLGAAMFDARAQGEPRREVRRARGPRAEAELLDSIDGLVRELFGLPAASVARGPQAAPAGGAEAITSPAVAPAHGRGPSWVAISAGGLAVALLGAGGIVGLVANGSRNEYARAPAIDRSAVDRAIGIFDRAEGQATAANVLFLAGAVGAAAAVILFIAQGSGSAE